MGIVLNIRNKHPSGVVHSKLEINTPVGCATNTIFWLYERPVGVGCAPKTISLNIRKVNKHPVGAGYAPKIIV